MKGLTKIVYNYALCKHQIFCRFYKISINSLYQLLSALILLSMLSSSGCVIKVNIKLLTRAQPRYNVHTVQVNIIKYILRHISFSRSKIYRVSYGKLPSCSNQLSFLNTQHRKWGKAKSIKGHTFVSFIYVWTKNSQRYFYYMMNLY